VHFDAVVVRAGFAACALTTNSEISGVNVGRHEAGGGVGGTWHRNRYPGTRCDVEAYSGQFDPTGTDKHVREQALQVSRHCDIGRFRSIPQSKK
jgi:cation diffusion facilitator CzcD-associated flavoprotein CzcO